MPEENCSHKQPDMIALYRRQAEVMADRFVNRFCTKYVEGGIKHGGDMFDGKSPRDMLIEAENEVLDQWSYLQAARAERERLRGEMEYYKKRAEQSYMEVEALRVQLSDAIARNRELAGD